MNNIVATFTILNASNSSKYLNFVIPTKSSTLTSQTIDFLSLFSGREILYISIIPMNDVKNTVNNEYLYSEIFKNTYIPTQTISTQTTVKAAGTDFFTIFLNKLPCIRSLLGSSAKINDGIPIVIALISVICIGINGYVTEIIINIIESKNEYIVLVI